MDLNAKGVILQGREKEEILFSISLAPDDVIFPANITGMSIP